MPVNIVKLIKDILDGIGLYVYGHFSAIWILIRHPIRGPRYLAYRSVKIPDSALSPGAFLLVNLLIAFYFMELSWPLTFVFWNPSFTWPALVKAIEDVRTSKVDFLPTIFRSLVLFVTAYAVIDVVATQFIRSQSRRTYLRNSLLFSLGLQPLGIIVGFAYFTKYNLFSFKHVLFILLSTLGVIALIAALFVAYAITALRSHRTSTATPWHRTCVAGLFSSLLLILLYVEAAALFSLPLFEPANHLVVSHVQCKIIDTNAVIVDALLDNPTNRREVIRLTDAAKVAVWTETQFDILAGVPIWSDSKLLEGGTVDTSAGVNAPYLTLSPGASGWIRVRAPHAAFIDKGKPCSFMLQRDSVAGDSKLMGDLVTGFSTWN